MANTFTKATAESIGTSEVDFYTVPASTTSVVHSLFLSNKITAPIKVDVKLNTTLLLKNVEILDESTLVFNKPINLLTTDVLKITSDTATSLDAVAAILEVS